MTNASTSAFGPCPKASSSAAGELVRPGDLADADARAERGRLDEHRPAELLADAPGDRRVLRVVVGVAQGDRVGAGDPGVAQHRLAHVLVHRHRRGEHARADVRDAGGLEQPLHRAVLAERPVQHREDDVDVADPVGQHLAVLAPHQGLAALAGHQRRAARRAELQLLGGRLELAAGQHVPAALRRRCPTGSTS